VVKVAEFPQDLIGSFCRQKQAFKALNRPFIGSNISNYSSLSRSDPQPVLMEVGVVGLHAAVDLLDS